MVAGAQLPVGQHENLSASRQGQVTRDAQVGARKRVPVGIREGQGVGHVKQRQKDARLATGAVEGGASACVK